ncbi:glycosyltransferase family 4 protein [Legionella saoudiensis]|uniref:glycosyltransferase family 4 protein n=1 Tax=Legionella saoudiensis TaxID=1750561 RepID=UPI00072FF97C|nr:glycosyltransferase family 4 protein [Legionella saoudiensis]
MSERRLLFIVNDAAFFISHRLPLAIAAKANGFEVHVATPEAQASAQIKEMGLTYHAIPLSRSGRNPFVELKSLFAFYRLMREVKPDLVHLVTIKPILYGGLVARLLKVPAVVAAVSGLGYLFTSQQAKAKFLRQGVRQLYKLALDHAYLKVIFQNPDDRQVFLQNATCTAEQTVLIRGSGVDLNIYRSSPERRDKVVVAMISRLLKDKGVLEYMAAAKALKAEGTRAQFLLVGDVDEGNPECIDKEQLAQWRREGDVELLGFRDDIAQIIEQANLVVLPSYREGLPKVLVEAAACGRAVITTDVPGCRDAIEPNQTGLLVPVRDVDALAVTMKQLIEDHDYRQQLGNAGRVLAEREFAIERIVDAHLNIYQELYLSTRGCTS